MIHILNDMQYSDRYIVVCTTFTLSSSALSNYYCIPDRNDFVFVTNSIHYNNRLKIVCWHECLINITNMNTRNHLILVVCYAMKSNAVD